MQILEVADVCRCNALGVHLQGVAGAGVYTTPIVAASNNSCSAKSGLPLNNYSIFCSRARIVIAVSTVNVFLYMAIACNGNGVAVGGLFFAVAA